MDFECKIFAKPLQKSGNNKPLYNKIWNGYTPAIVAKIVSKNFNAIFNYRGHVKNRWYYSNNQYILKLVEME